MVKNQQMLIMGEKYKSEWKALKMINSRQIPTKHLLVHTKAPSSINLKSWFKNIMVTEVRSITLNESHDQALTNHSQCIKIANAKSKPRAKKRFKLKFQ